MHVDEERAHAVFQLAGEVALLRREHPARSVRRRHRVVRPGEHDLVQALRAQALVAVAAGRQPEIAGSRGPAEPRDRHRHGARDDQHHDACAACATASGRRDSRRPAAIRLRPRSPAGTAAGGRRTPGRPRAASASHGQRGRRADDHRDARHDEQRPAQHLLAGRLPACAPASPTRAGPCRGASGATPASGRRRRTPAPRRRGRARDRGYRPRTRRTPRPPPPARAASRAARRPPRGPSGSSMTRNRPASATSSDARRSARARRGASAIPRDQQRQPPQHADARHPRQVAAELPQVEDELAGGAAAQARDQRREPRRDRGGEGGARVGERAAQHQVHVGHRQQQGAAAPREYGRVRLAGGDAHDGREGIGRTTPLAVDSSSGRTATRSGFSCTTAFVIASATNADTRGSRRLPARRSANASLSNRPRRT